MIYEIPGSACANRMPVEVQAEKPGVRGLLVTESDAKLGWNVTHEMSGFCIAGWPDKRKALASARLFGKLPIDWTKPPRSLFEQTAKLTDKQIDKFMVARGSMLVANYDRFRKNVWEQLKDPSFPRNGK